MTRPKTSQKAYRETAKRAIKKLLIVLIAAVAFFLLRTMENAKIDYEKKRANPIVIVQQNAPALGDGPEYVIKLSREPIETELEKILHPSEQELKMLQEKSERKQTNDVLLKSLTKFRETIKNSISTARRVPFESEEKFVAYLSDNIDKAKREAEDYLAIEKKKRRAAIENLRGKFANRPQEFETNLKKEPGTDTDFGEEFEKESKKLTQTTTATGPQSSAPQEARLTDALVTAATTIEDRREAGYRDKIGESAYDTKDKFYRSFVPTFLTKYVREQRELSPHPSTLSEMVLDKQRGGHVIYQIFYLAFIGVLVFGILFPIYLLLSALPPFAGSVEPITERAKDLLSRQGIASTIAAPEVMKTIALSMSAIGIGAAVVIANNPVTGKGDPGLAGAPVESPYTPPKVPPGSSSPSVPPIGSPSPQVSPSPPDGDPTPSPAPPINLYPSFSPTFTVDNARLGQLEREYGRTNQTLQELITKELPVKLDRNELPGLISKELDPTRQLAQSVAAKVPEIERKFDRQFETLNTTTIPNLSTEISSKHSELSGRLNDTNSAITEFREGTQGRSFLNRASELFGRERYQVTRGSYDVIHRLLCNKAACPPGTTEKLIRNLELLIDKPSMDKKTFQKWLEIGAGRAIPKTTLEPLILRYSRVPY